MDITIIRTEIQRDCECCGIFSDVEVRLLRDGVEIAGLDHDGHFGRGDDLSDARTVLPAMLAPLGFAVTPRHKALAISRGGATHVFRLRRLREISGHDDPTRMLKLVLDRFGFRAAVERRRA